MDYMSEGIYWIIFLVGCLVTICAIAEGLEFIVTNLIKLAKGVKKWNNTL